MFFVILLTLVVTSKVTDGLSWNTSDGILPWESYLKLGDIQRPLGLELNRSSLAHHHFAIGYLCLQSFMYDEAQDAFNLAINMLPTLIEAHIGKMLACKHALWADTDFDCGLAAYDTAQMMVKKTNITLTHLQSSLLAAAFQWYGNQSSVRAGERAFLSCISNISQTYSNETDLRVLWGLSLLNVAYDRQFENEIQPKAMIESREVLEKALKMEANHPGALHYLIHAYDIDLVDVAEKASTYALLYNKTVLTLSHAQHMPGHIWMRTGAWLYAISADATAVRVSLELCAIKLLNRHVTILSTELEDALNLFNTTGEILSFLECDAENRAHSTEWLSYSRLQTGDWLGNVAAFRDLVLADNRSLLTPKHYLPFAYRAQGRTIVDLFFWFPYSEYFLNKIQPLLIFSQAQTLVLFGDDHHTSSWYPIWAEAGYRFAECLRLLTTVHTNNNTSGIFSIVDNHLSRFVILSNRTSSLSKYISHSILMMIPQILGIRYYVNGSLQECLKELNTATQIESTLIAGSNSPTLIYARSSELLAMHLLIIYEQYQHGSIQMNSTTFILNGTEVSVDKFPSIALSLFSKADQVAPNRAINTLGLARSNAHLDQHSIAVNLYQQLVFQMASSNYSDDSFLREANEYLDKHSSAMKCSFSFILMIFSLVPFYFAMHFQ